MHEVASFLKTNDVYFLLGLSALSLLLLVFVLILWRKQVGFSRKRNGKLEDGRVGDIIDFLDSLADGLEKLQEQIDGLRKIQSEHGRALSSCISNVGVVRFDAFDDVGGEQSFAIVMLDSAKNGVAFSSLYGRQDSRVYAKAIYGGQGERPLSAEEQQALSKALKQPDAAPVR